MKKKLQKTNSKTAYMEKKASLDQIKLRGKVLMAMKNAYVKDSHGGIYKKITVNNGPYIAPTQADLIIQNKIKYVPKVSVVMPVFNAGPYLRQCLDSVLHQTLKNIEVICVDDGSDDDSLKILQEYAQKDNRITVLRQNNLHAGIARNAGLSLAKGDYVHFLDADDFFEPDMLRAMSRKADEDASDIVICAFDAYDDGKKITLWQKTADRIFANASPFAPERFASDLYDCTNPAPWSKMFKRHFFINNNLFFEDLKCCNDLTCVYTALSLARKISITNNVYIHYRTGQKNNLTSRKQNRASDYIRAIARLERNLKATYLFDIYSSSFYAKAVDNWNWEVNNCSEKNKKIVLQDAQQILSPTLYQSLLKPKVSVIIPVYNTELYLKECLDSLVHQSLPEIEILCVDDGSTDSSIAIMESYARKDARIKIFQQNHKRAGAARNLGIKMATGKYVYFIDSDDFLDKHCLKKLYNKLEQAHADVCIYGLKKYDHQTKKIYADSYYDMSCFADVIDNICTFTDIKNQIFRRFGAFFEMYRRDFFIKNDLFFAEDILIGEDVLTHVKSLVLANKICFYNENLYYYRINRPGSSMTTSKQDTTIFDVFSYLTEVEQFFKENHYFEVLEQQFTDFALEQFLFHLGRMSTDKFKQEFIQKAVTYLSTLSIYKILHSPYLPEFQKVTNNRLSVPVKMVSVIIPVFNVEKYLRQCLDSVIRQNLPQIEVICVNDGSTDGSLDILKEYAAKDNRIIIIDQKNQGLSCSRNNAMKIATGEYLMFLDSDDYIKQGSVKKLYQFATQHNLDFLSFNGQNFISGSHVFENNEYWGFDFLPEDFNTTCFTYKDCIPFINKMPVSSCLTMYRRHFITTRKLQFPKGLFYEDNVFYTKAFLLAQRCGILDEKLYCRRIHAASVTQNWDKHFADYIKIVDIVLTWVRKHKPELFPIYYNMYLFGTQYRFQNFNTKTRKKYTRPILQLFKKYRFKNSDIRPPAHIFRAFIFFPLNCFLMKRKTLRYFRQLIGRIRIDIKNFGAADNEIEIQAANMQLSHPSWFTNEYGIGMKMEGPTQHLTFKVKAIKNGRLRFDFRAADMRYKGERFPVWIDYQSIKIDGKEVLKQPVQTWHDKPFRYEMPVSDGQVLLIELKTKPHNYTQEQLLDVVLKLNPHLKYVKDHANKLVKLLSAE